MKTEKKEDIIENLQLIRYIRCSINSDLKAIDYLINEILKDIKKEK